MKFSSLEALIKHNVSVLDSFVSRGHAGSQVAFTKVAPTSLDDICDDEVLKYIDVRQHPGGQTDYIVKSVSREDIGEED